MPRLNADRQSVRPAADARLGDDEEEEKVSANDYEDAGVLPAIASMRSDAKIVIDCALQFMVVIS